jgi:transcriptional regulator with XRE-family HTH domain
MMDNVGMPRKSPPRDSLGTVLQKARKAQSLSIRQVAGLLDVQPSQVSRWERDEFPPSATALLGLVRVLELSAEDLFALAGIAERPSLPAMLRREYDLPPEAIAEAQAAVEAVARKYQQPKPRTTKARQ